MKYAVKTTCKRKSRKLPGTLMFLCSCAVMLLCSSVSVRAETLPETARLLPPETILLVDIDDFSQLRTQFEKTDFYKFYKDRAMAAFFDDFKTKGSERIREQDNKVLRTIVNVDALPQGRAAVALVLNPPTAQTKDASELPLLFITQWGQTIAKVREVVDKMVKEAVEDGAHRRTEDYRGVSITTLINQSSAALSYCYIDDSLIGSVNLDVLKFVIAHIKGAASPALADDADYTTTLKTIGPHAPGRVNLYVNIKQILKTIIAEDATGEAKTIMANLGLDNVISFGCSIGLGGGPGNSSFGKAFLKTDGAKKGICKMLDVESATLRAPQFIPASAFSVSFVNLNIKKAYSELANILNSISPQFAAIMYMPLLPSSPQGEPPLQLKTDIIDHLGSQIIIAQSTSKPSGNAGSQVQPKSLVAVALDNRSALEKSLSLLHSRIIAPNPDARRELLGHTMYLIDLSTMLPAFKPGERTPMQALLKPDAPKMPKLAFTVTDTHLIFASESVVEQAIRTLSSTETVSVGSANWFNKAKSAIPSVVGMAGLQDISASGEYFWQMLQKTSKKSKAEDSSVKMGVAMSPRSVLPYLMSSQAGSDLFNFGLLPEFDAVRKYFGLSAFYGISRPDGFFFEFKYLNPVGN